MENEPCADDTADAVTSNASLNGWRAPPAGSGRLRCAIYARSATFSNKESIEAQIAACRDVAASKGWEILDECNSSSTLVGRTGLQTLIVLAECWPRPFDFILLSYSSRLGRNLTDVFSTIEERNHGLAIYVAGLEIVLGSELFCDLATERLTGNKICRPPRAAGLQGFWCAVREFFGVLFRGSIFT